MANRKFSQFTAGGASQVPTDVLVGLDLSQASALQNTKWTLNNLFAKPTLNITDGAMRFGAPGAAPAVSAAAEGSIYFDGTQFQVSSNAGAYTPLGNITGSFTSGQVAYANSASSLTSSSGLLFSANALTIGTSGTPGGLRLVGATGNYWNQASNAPAANKTFYWPDSTTPTTGNFLFISNAGVQLTSDWSTGLTWSNTTKQLTITGAVNGQIGFTAQNTSAGTAAESLVGFTANGGAISLLSLTGTGFTTSGLYHANQLYWRGTTGITDITFALDDASTNFRFGVNSAIVASINATSTEGLVLGIASSLTGRIKLYNSAGATYTQISAGNAASSLNYILPATAPTAGQVLTAAAPSGSNVTLSWGAGGGGALAVNNVSGSPTFAGVTTLLVDDVNGGISAVNSGGNPSLGVVAGTGISVTSGVAVDQATAFAWTAAHTLSVNSTQSATTAGTTYQPSTSPSSGQYRWSPALVLNGAANSGSGANSTGFRLYTKGSDSAGTAALTIEQRNVQISSTWFQVAALSQAGALSLGVASQSTGGLTLFNSAGTTSTTLQAGNAASSLTFVWPVVDPTAGQVLSASAPSGGTVTLSWATASGGSPGGSGSELQYRSGASTFGAVTNSSVSGANIATQGTITQTVSSATAFTVGPNGATNPTLNIVTNVASAATGLSVTGNAAGSGVTLTALSSGSNENLALVPKGTGAVTFPPGTASLPGLAFTGESTTGIYRPVAGLIGMTASGISCFITASTVFRLAFTTAFGFASGDAGTTNIDTGAVRAAAGVWRFTNGSTGSSSLIVGPSTAAIGTGGAAVLALANGTAPSSSPADTVQLYEADAAAGDGQLFARNEAGTIARLTGTTFFVSSQFDKTSDITLALVTGLSVNLEAGKTYKFECVLFMNCNSAGGVQIAMNGGTATATAIIRQVQLYNATVLDTSSRFTDLSSSIASTGSTSYFCRISGTITVNAAGTFGPSFAQSVSNGTASSVLVGSSLQIAQS